MRPRTQSLQPTRTNQRGKHAVGWSLTEQEAHAYKRKTRNRDHSCRQLPLLLDVRIAYTITWRDIWQSGSCFFFLHNLDSFPCHTFPRICFVPLFACLWKSIHEVLTWNAVNVGTSLLLNFSQLKFQRSHNLIDGDDCARAYITELSLRWPPWSPQKGKQHVNSWFADSIKPVYVICGDWSEGVIPTTVNSRLRVIQVMRYWLTFFTMKCSHRRDRVLQNDVRSALVHNYNPPLRHSPPLHSLRVLAVCAFCSVYTHLSLLLSVLPAERANIVAISYAK